MGGNYAALITALEWSGRTKFLPYASKVRYVFIRLQHARDNVNLDMKTAPKKPPNFMAAPCCDAPVCSGTKPLW